MLVPAIAVFYTPSKDGNDRGKPNHGNARARKAKPARMTLDQALLFALFAAILAMLVWGRFRHDLVAAGGLLIAVAIGLVPQEAAFSGFSNPAVVIVALVLVASRAFRDSGLSMSFTSSPIKGG